MLKKYTDIDNKKHILSIFKELIKNTIQLLMLFTKLYKVRYLTQVLNYSYFKYYIGSHITTLLSCIYKYTDVLNLLKIIHIDYKIKRLKLIDIVNNHYTGNDLIKLSDIDKVYKCYDTAVPVDYLHKFNAWFKDNITNEDLQLLDINHSCLMYSAYTQNSSFYIISPCIELQKYLDKYILYLYLS